MNELMALYNIKKVQRKQFVQKYKETILKKKEVIQWTNTSYYIYIQSTNKRKQQHLTDKDTTSGLKHSQPLTLKNTSTDQVKQYPFTMSTNIQTIQVMLLRMYTQEEN